MSRRLGAWLDARAPRERWLLAMTAVVAIVALLLSAAVALRHDLVRLESEATRLEHDLAHVRRLRAVLAGGRAVPTEGDAAGAPSLLTRLETAADAVVGRERIADMTPTTAPQGEGPHEERVALRLSGASLAETVRLLHSLESAAPPLVVTRLALRKHPDDAHRFDATFEVSHRTAPPEAP